jgi:hypothetical protein
MALRSTQPPTKMSTRNLPGGKKQPARRVDNLAAILEPNVRKCEPQPLTNLRASMACTGITLPFTLSYACINFSSARFIIAIRQLQINNSNELSSINILNEGKLCGRSQMSKQACISVYCIDILFPQVVAPCEHSWPKSVGTLKKYRQHHHIHMLTTQEHN